MWAAGASHSRKSSRASSPPSAHRCWFSNQARFPIPHRLRCTDGALMRKLTANDKPDERERITLAEAEAMLPTPDGKRSTAVFEHGTLQVKLYAPRGADLQQPHA